MPSILISGYYGFDNLGDDTVLYGILSGLRKLRPTATFTVLSNQPKRTETLFGIRAVDRWNLGTIFRELRKTDLLVMGGGSLLQDVTGPRSILYYLGIVALAKFLGKPVVFYAQGIGPVNKPLSKRLIKSIVNRVDLITVRDDKSHDDLQSFGVIRPPVHVTADPALAIEPLLFQPETGQAIFHEFHISPTEDRSRQVIGIAIRKWNAAVPYIDILAKAADRLVQQGYQVVFVPMQFPRDVEISREIADHMVQPSVVLDRQFSFREIASIIANLDIMVGMRLHSLILAAICNIPFVPISYDPKIDRFIHRMGMGKAIHVNQLDEETLVAQILACQTQFRENQPHLQHALQELRKEAEKSGELAVHFLKSAEPENGWIANQK
ncbi:polysaccharide pyruvyl transferase CsaB [Fodinisporobacter ferrooxydans]|uniref:Polysaccharide pyruvyl transferase CsaB n=1 Tax=Fodinisporobacter ferrooxydans TaxID=2901836 RepID=A0ABY4CN61_9BACL|nr:polysaccharide pyruvyl transferase CsaB [Alicyclobacillaceae bacterium MYW30-H2]